MTATLIQRLRDGTFYAVAALMNEAADALEQQAAQIAEKDAEIARLKAAPSVAPEPREPLPEVLFNGYGVWHMMTPEATRRTTPENVSDVLDAVVKWMRANPAHPPRAPLTDEQAQAMWTAATIEQCSHENCYLRGLRDAEHAHGIGGK